jgi:Domain of unknown function (DUF3786)
MEEQRGENPFDEPTRRLKAADPASVAEKAGGTWEPAGEGGRLLLPALNGTVSVSWPDVRVEAPGGLDSFSLKLLALIYLANADGTAPSGTWVAYRELPGGRFYEPVVKRSVEDPLALAYGSDPEGFTSACAALGGTGLSLGDASCAFALFPNVLLAFILWHADEEFDARAQVLFDSNDTRHLNAFDLRMGAQEISSRLIKAGGGAR